MTNIFNVDSPDWMLNPNRNCAIPDEFNAAEIRDAADAWFPTASADARYAKRLCDGCPVQRQCFMYAYQNPEIEGIWGGTTTGQRARLRTKAGANAA